MSDQKKPWDETYHLDEPGDVCLGHAAVAVVLDPESDPEHRQLRGKMFMKAPELVRTLLSLGSMRRIGAVNEWHLKSCPRAGTKDHCDFDCATTHTVLVEVGAL